MILHWLKLLIKEMKTAALRGAVSQELYAECFKAYPALADAVLRQGVADRIIKAWKQVAKDKGWDGDGSELETDAGRKAWLVEGPILTYASSRLIV